MKKLKWFIRRKFTTLLNVVMFLSVVIERRWPINKWPMAWHHVQQQHELEVRRMLTELTMQGEIKRRVKDGEFVYYPMDKE